jgi:hypothetical protein
MDEVITNKKTSVPFRLLNQQTKRIRSMSIQVVENRAFVPSNAILEAVFAIVKKYLNFEP